MWGIGTVWSVNEWIHTLNKRVWMDSIKGCGSTQDVIDGPHCIFQKSNMYIQKCHCKLILNLPLIRGLKILWDATEQDVLLCAMLW